MSATDLDPTFVKALKLLHSKSSDSADQLKAMLDDAIAQRKGLKPSRDPEAENKKSKGESSKSKKDEKESKDKERAKKDRDRKEKEERDARKEKERVEKEKRDKELDEEKDSMMIVDDVGPASSMDAGDFAVEMGIACVVCSQFEVSSGNQLVECQECHSLYHQECHNPPLNEGEISDPRFVWYCSKCQKSLKKMASQKASKLKTQTPSSLKEPSISAKPNKSDSSSQAFRAISAKTIAPPKEAPPTSSTSKPMIGLAGLAANLTKPKADSKSGSFHRKSDTKGDDGRSSKDAGRGLTKSVTDGAGKPSKSTTAGDSSSKSSSRHDSLTKAGKSEEKKSDPHKTIKNEKEKSDKKPEKNRVEDKLKPKDDKKEKSLSSSSKYSTETSVLAKLELSINQSGRDLSPNSESASSSISAPTSPSQGQSNKQAVANLSLVTANKRIQMMKKKAQTKPHEKVHIK